MPRNHGRNVVAAGLFLVLMVAAAVVLLVLVAGRSLWFEETTELKVHFEEAPGIKPGSVVTFRGLEVGRVTVVRPIAQDQDGRNRYLIEVVISVPKKYQPYRNARIVITHGLVGTSATVNIQELGFPETKGGPPAEVVRGNQVSPFAAAAADLGIGDTEKKNIQEILANLRHVSADLKEDLPEVLAKAKATAGNLEKLSGDLKTDYPEIHDKFLATAAELEKASEQATAGLEKMHAILDENRENVKKTTAHVAGFAEKLDTDGGSFVENLDGEDVGEILDNVKAASADLKVAMADFKRLAADGKTLMVTHKGNLTKTVLNFRAVSEHLKATAKEVRRAPWRLLAQPDKEEVETLNLYDAARAFGTAAADLDSFSDSLRLLAEAEEAGIEVDPEIVRGMMQRLEDTFERYKEAEEALWKEFGRIQK